MCVSLCIPFSPILSSPTTTNLPLVPTVFLQCQINKSKMRKKKCKGALIREIGVRTIKEREETGKNNVKDVWKKTQKIILYLSKIIYEAYSYISVSICRENLSEVMPFGVIIPHNSHTIFNKNSSTGKKKSPFGLLLSRVQEALKQYRPSLLPLIASQKLKVSTYH